MQTLFCFVIVDAFAELLLLTETMYSAKTDEPDHANKKPTSYTWDMNIVGFSLDQKFLSYPGYHVWAVYWLHMNSCTWSVSDDIFYFKVMSSYIQVVKTLSCDITCVLSHLSVFTN